MNIFDGNFYLLTVIYFNAKDNWLDVERCLFEIYEIRVKRCERWFNLKNVITLLRDIWYRLPSLLTSTEFKN